MTDFERNDELDIVEGEILGESGDQDHTMLHLPSVPEDEYYDDFEDYGDDADYAVFDEEDGEPGDIVDPGRRGFLSRILLGGVAAAALGGSAALLYEEQAKNPPKVGAFSLPGGNKTADLRQGGMPTQDPGQMQAALASVTADRDRLQAELDQANQDLVEVRAALDSALAELDGHRNLNSLWQQLDNVGLDVMMAAAVGTMGGNLANLLRVAGVLRNGLEVARSVTNWFTNAMLRPQNGLRWLGRQVNALATSIDWLLEQVEEVVQPAATLAATLTNFVFSVLDRLPGNFGTRAEAGLNAMSTVLDQLPELIRGVNEDVLDPLADWFGTDEARNLQGLLVKPVVENVFGPASDVLAKVDEVDTTFNQELAQPARGALDERASLRERIRQAQSDLGLSA